MAIDKRYRVLETDYVAHIDMYTDIDCEITGECYVMKQDSDRIIIVPDQLDDVITVLTSLKEQASKRGANG